jgi:FixJ family two-component response regulator
VTPELVHVVDDDARLRGALDRLLRAHGLDVRTYATADEFLAAAEALKGGCVIVDYKLPGLTGLELQEVLVKQGGDWQLVFLSGYVDVPKSVKAMKHGAMDVLVKPAPDAAVIGAVQRALERTRAAGEARQARDEIEGRIASLTPRERQVMELVITGLLNKQIAAQLGAAERTVKTHRARVMEKMGVRSVAQLVHLTEKIGLKAE